MINTYNESHLHEKLKEIYALEFDGETEKKIEGTKWIADILLKNGDVIEIQTGNISALKEKVNFLINNSEKNVKVVKPVLIEKHIENYDENEKRLSRRKSPKKENIFSILKGLTGIYEILGNEHLEIEIVFVKSTEKRQKTNEKTQLKNRSRRHLKDWIPLGKTLDSIEGKLKLKTKDDFKNLIPDTIPKNFTVKELQLSIKGNVGQTRLLLWLLKKMEIVKESGKRGREKEYEFIMGGSKNCNF